MDLKEISQYYELRKKLEKYNEILEVVRTKAENITMNISGLPASGAISDRVARYGGLIAQLEIDIEEKNKELRRAKRRTQRYIDNIEDTYTRTIFQLRFIELMSWSDIANDSEREESIKKMCYRYLREH